jgi:four helix bundle protein
MHDHRRLEVYHQALDLAEAAYGVARSLPDIERFELSSQIRRASTSIAANIAEGAGRDGPKEFARFLRIAIGSACEVEALMDLVARLYPEHTSTATAVRSATRPLVNRLHRLELQATR